MQSHPANKLKKTKDHYRPLFCTNLFYKENQIYFRQWKQMFNSLTSSEKVQAWVIALTLLRRPDDWFGGLRKSTFLNQSQMSQKGFLQHPLTLQELVQNTSIQIPAHLPAKIQLCELISSYKIKPLPDSCLKSLSLMKDETYPLKVIFWLPTPMELLSYQLKKQRIISLNEDYELWPEMLYAERDFLSFLIHDLIHADHFFSNNTNRDGQLGFYRCIQQILNDHFLCELLQNENFKKGFEYIISDMNSHPVHLFKTLHARLKQTVNENKLSFQIWKSWVSLWTLEDQESFSALQNINTQLFSDIDALTIESFSIALGQN